MVAFDTVAHDRKTGGSQTHPYERRDRAVRHGLGGYTRAAHHERGLDEAGPGGGEDGGGDPVDEGSGVEEETGPAAVAVFGLEGAQGGGVAEAGTGGGFDFDGKEAVAGLDHEVDFFADGGAPVEDFRGIEAGVAPGEKVVQDEVFQVGAAGLGFLAEVEGRRRYRPSRAWGT